jgi:hypothetical protein
MTLDEFIATVEREQPETLSAAFVASVQPQPWVNRAGHGKDARIRMTPGGVHYERHPDSPTWYRSDTRSDFDVLDLVSSTPRNPVASDPRVDGVASPDAAGTVATSGMSVPVTAPPHRRIRIEPLVVCVLAVAPAPMAGLAAWPLKSDHSPPHMTAETHHGTWDLGLEVPTGMIPPQALASVP